MSTLLKMQKFHPLCSRCIGMYPLQNRWTVLRYLQCYENFSECCTHLILPETALFSPTPTFAKEPIISAAMLSIEVIGHTCLSCFTLNFQVIVAVIKRNNSCDVVDTVSEQDAEIGAADVQ